MQARLYRTLRRRSLNQLLVVHLLLASPLVVLAVVFHGVFAVVGYMYIPLGWAVISHLRRLAWKQQFRPRAKASTGQG